MFTRCRSIYLITKSKIRHVGWDAHVRRNNAGILWPASVLRERSRSWLIVQRARFAPSVSHNPRAWTSLAGRTATRERGGGVAVRFEDGVINATEAIDNDRKRKLLDLALHWHKRPRSCDVPARQDPGGASACILS